MTETVVPLRHLRSQKASGLSHYGKKNWAAPKWRTPVHTFEWDMQ
jgi:hypothetical protein